MSLPFHLFTGIVLEKKQTSAAVFSKSNNYYLKQFNDRKVMSTVTIAIVEFGGNFRPILDRIISYPNPKVTCNAKIQCRLQELWPLEDHSLKTKIFWGFFFFSYRH